MVAESLLTVQPFIPILDSLNITIELTLDSITGSVIALSTGDVTVEIGVVPSMLIVALSVGGVAEGIEFPLSIEDQHFHTISIIINMSR